MCFGKELLLSCIVMMHISFMNSESVDFGKLRENMKKMDSFSVFCHLQKAEDYYVKHLFGGEPPYTVEPIEGITLKNTTEGLEASICAIIDYLDKHLPKIMSLFRNKFSVINKSILNNTEVFLFHFNQAVNSSSSDQNETGASIQCHRPVTMQDDYTMKVRGLRIINSTRQWVETFTDTPISDMCIPT